jgi:hypothetical protein
LPTLDYLSSMSWIPTTLIRSAVVRFAASLAVVMCFCRCDGVAGEPVSFELDVQPVLTAQGCNMGACHGKQRGQNGFQLSLLGFDPEFDYRELTRGARGRRLFPAAPEESLLLQKAIATVPHGGGRRFTADSPAYQTLLDWIRQGAPRRLPDEPQLERVTLEQSALQ